MLHTLAFDILHVYCLFIASKHPFHIKSGNLRQGAFYTTDLLSARVTTCLISEQSSPLHLYLRLQPQFTQFHHNIPNERYENVMPKQNAHNIEFLTLHLLPKLQSRVNPIFMNVYSFSFP